MYASQERKSNRCHRCCFACISFRYLCVFAESNVSGAECLAVPGQYNAKSSPNLCDCLYLYTTQGRTLLTWGDKPRNCGSVR